VRTPVLDADVALGLQFGALPARYARFGLAGHDGVDFLCQIGTQVLAPIAGVVLARHDDPNGWGLNLEMADQFNRRWFFCHLSDFGASVAGDEVIAGTPIASSGNTGNSTAPHLHVTLQPDVTYSGGLWRGRVDPYPFLRVLGTGALA
jgi:murein DD-endopeptidase MepM/ murein hydrolase activator NlpD